MNVRVNPLGVMYNPLSVARCFGILYSDRVFAERDLYLHEGLWHSFDHHGSFSGPSPADTAESINKALGDVRSGFGAPSYIVMTLGTPWVYFRNGNAVANCHKFPEGEFVRRRMSVADVVDALEPVIRRDPAVKVVLTVSPVRHLRDGLAESGGGKAVLRVACDELAARNPNVWYFPAYEIMTDELRDYRFYASDMLHPSEVAVQYLWERFLSVAVDAPSADLMTRAGRIRQAMLHRPLYPGGAEYGKFRESMRMQAQKLAEQYKDVDFREELQFFA